MHLRYALDRREILDWLLDQGLEINGPSNRTLKCTDDTFLRDNTVEVLNRAATIGDIDLFDHLVARGAKPSQSNALHNASRSENAVAMITHLINTYHLDINASESCGGLNKLDQWATEWGPPLYYAIIYSNLPAAEVLLNYGAEIGGSCGLAIMKKNTPAVKLLLDKGADPSKNLGYAITGNYFEGCKLCLEHGSDDIAIVEARNKMVAGFGGAYTGMSKEIRELLDEWK